MQNCSADFGQQLVMPETKGRKVGRQGMTSSRSEQTEDPTSVNNDKYYSVKCDVCSTRVAVYDQDEVYHFFNVLSSHC